MATEEERVKGVVMPAFGRMLWRHGGEPGMLIPLLQAAQDSYGYIPPLAIEQIAMATGIPASEIYGVITFYRQFRLQPLGRYVIRICKGTACHVQGAEMIGRTLEEELGIHEGETSEDGLFTFLYGGLPRMLQSRSRGDDRRTGIRQTYSPDAPKRSPKVPTESGRGRMTFLPASSRRTRCRR